MSHKHDHSSRRNFLKTSALAGVGMSLAGASLKAADHAWAEAGMLVGIIGLDTSHVVAFTKALNNPENTGRFLGYKVVAAYPKGTRDIEASLNRVEGYTQELKKMGVEIVSSIDNLLEKVDVVLLETVDGRMHLEQVLPVLKAGKTVFVDKPVAGTLVDAITIFEAAAHYKVPLFSASSLRYTENAQKVAKGIVGKVVGADAYSPCTLEPSHPDLFWYGIHGCELLFTAMGEGCQSLSRVHTESTDIVTGIWEGDRVGVFRGTRTGKHTYGGTAYGSKGDAPLGPYSGYEPLLDQIVKFFRDGKVPVTAAQTIEIFTFMEAADESKRRGGVSVELADVLAKAQQEAKGKLQKLLS